MKLDHRVGRDQRFTATRCRGRTRYCMCQPWLTTTDCPLSALKPNET